MLKAAAVVAVPSVLGGVGLLFSPGEMPTPPSPYQGAYAVEVGMVFGERAVRGALPKGFEPASGCTGGIAIYGGDEGWALSPLSTGHVWIDVVDEASGTPSRYMLTSFASEAPEGTSTTYSDAAALGETRELGDDGVLHILAWPDRVSILELVVKPSTDPCTARSTVEHQDLLTSGPGGRLGVLHMPAALDWCDMEADVGWASVTAPFGHVLRPFVPQQVLWARIAQPLDEASSVEVSELRAQ